MVSCQKGPSRHAYTWQIGPFWQDTLAWNKPLSLAIYVGDMIPPTIPTQSVCVATWRAADCPATLTYQNAWLTSPALINLEICSSGDLAKRAACLTTTVTNVQFYMNMLL